MWKTKEAEELENKMTDKNNLGLPLRVDRGKVLEELKKREMPKSLWTKIRNFLQV